MRPVLEDGMRRIVLAGMVLVGLLGHAGSLAAQIAEVSPGARIRFRAPPIVATRTKATVLERHGDTLRVGPERGSPFDVPMSSLATLDISRGKSRWEGAKVGALWSGGLYLLFGLAVLPSGDTCPADVGGASRCSPRSKARDVTEITLGGTVVGAVIGALIGREKWERVPLVGRTSAVTR